MRVLFSTVSYGLAPRLRTSSRLPREVPPAFFGTMGSVGGHPGTRTRWPLGICRAALRRISCARNVTVTEAIPVIIGGGF